MADTMEHEETLRTRREQLDALHAAGVLDDAAHAQGRARLAQPLDDAGGTGTTAAPPRPRRRGPVDPVLIGALLAGLAIVAIGYAWMARQNTTAGSALPAPEAMGAATTAAPHSMNTEQIRAMVASLEQRLAARPDDADGWGMLARSWTVLGDNPKAISAYRQALKLTPADAVLMADFADALAVSQGGRIEGEALRLVEQALVIDTNQPKALSLSGSAAFDRGDWAGAVEHWGRLQEVGPADHPLVKQMASGLAEARQSANAAALPVPTATGSAARP